MPSVQTLRAEEGRLVVRLTRDLRTAIFLRRDFPGKKKKTHLCLFCRQTFEDVDLTFKIEFIRRIT